MRVAIVLKAFPPDAVGGMETQTRQMAAELRAAGHDVTVFTKAYGDHDDGDAPYEVVRVWNWQRTPFLSDLTFLVVALLAVFRRRREFDVLQCMMLYPVGFLGYVLNLVTELPYFAWIRGGDYYLMRDVRWKRWMMRRVLGDTLVLAQSEEIRADVRADFDDDIDPDLRVLGNAVSVPEARADGDGVLYVGRLAPKKGLEYLLRAVADLETHLTVVGDGAERDRLEALAAALEADVTFVGEVPPDRVEEFYRDAAVFVLPSVEGEGMPNAVLEAMAWGLPVVATDSGGLPSVIDDGQTGYVVPMRDSEALRERVDDLLAAPERREELGTAARQYVREHHSWAWLVGELEAVYRDLC